jgi:adenine deaminase
MSCDLVLRGGNIIDVASGRTYGGTVLIQEGRILRIDPPGSSCEDGTVIDVSGKYLSPGFVDSHLHIESSMLSPLEFCRRAVEHGTTTVFVDPHEIANVSGRKGIDLFLEQADLAPLDMFVGIPSCVPATGLEDAGAAITLRDVQELIVDSRVYGLGEMMNVPGIIHGDREAREKVDFVFDFGKLVDGHCPRLGGNDLLTYVSGGRNDGTVRITSDHESTGPEEAIEKRTAGMSIALRHGTLSRDLQRILPALVREGRELDGFMLCSDDLSPIELFEEGHVDRIIRIARDIIAANSDVNPEQATIMAIGLATLNPARHFARFFEFHDHPEIGEITPGKKANLVVLDSLEDVTVDKVIYDGRLVVDAGEYTGSTVSFAYPASLGEMNLGGIMSPSDFSIEYHGDESALDVKVIEVVEGSLETRQGIVRLPARDGEVQADPEQDVAKIAVIERHKGTCQHPYSVGFVRFLGVRKGAIGSTVAHDSHNLIVVGADDESMWRATRYLSENGSGMVVVVGDEITYLPLRLGGLMSTDGIETVVGDLGKVRSAVKKTGSGLENVFMAMSFLALPVIPELKITNRGLVDVKKFDFVDLY